MNARVAVDTDDYNLDFPGREQLLADARRRYAVYYAIASKRDADAMDLLVIFRAALEIGIRTPRAGLPDSVRLDLERTTDATEATFMEATQVVRGGPSYFLLGSETRAAIERELFTVTPPLEN